MEINPSEDCIGSEQRVEKVEVGEYLEDKLG